MDETVGSSTINSNKYKKKTKKLVFKLQTPIKEIIVKHECFTRNILHGIIGKSFCSFSGFNDDNTKQKFSLFRNISLESES